MEFVFLICLKILLVVFVEKTNRPNPFLSQIRSLYFPQVKNIIIRNFQFVDCLHLKSKFKEIYNLLF